MMAKKKADCPECEYCCAIGVCCPPAQQLATLTVLFMRSLGYTKAEARRCAKVIVDARQRAQA